MVKLYRDIICKSSYKFNWKTLHKDFFQHPLNHFIFSHHLSRNNYVHPHDAKFTSSLNGEKIMYTIDESEINTNQQTIHLIFCHGKSENMMSHRNHFRQLIHDAAKFNVSLNVINFDYQGFGYSEGTPTFKSCVEDLSSIIRMISSEIDNKNILLVGYSLGTGIVVEYCHSNKWKNPILLAAPYTSILDVIYKSNNFIIKKILSFIDVFKTIDKIDKLQCKIKIIHGTNDSYIDANHSREIMKKIIHPFRSNIKLIDSANHYDIVQKINFDMINETMKQ